MISRIYYTLSSLKLRQILYLFKYRIFDAIFKPLRKTIYTRTPAKQIGGIVFNGLLDKEQSFDNYSFSFINFHHKFENSAINWNLREHGMLWAYNLNYMDFINQSNIETETALDLIHDFIEQLPANKIGVDPYPISLRGINWIKFISKHNISSNQIDSSLYAQYHILYKNIEYHLMGNHLLENGFSLLFGAFYFNDKKLYKRGAQILLRELPEQILADGAHYELSPMYHQIVLERILDTINLFSNNKRFNDQDVLLKHMITYASKMLSWINYITFKSGDIPLFNDSAPGIASTTKQLIDYANKLGIGDYPPDLSLNDCGYRKFSNNNYECVIDVGTIGPHYQPGHAHADTFSFALNIGNKPFIVDPGISTYNPTVNRLKERSTLFHNTVTVANLNSSDVWSSFRVGRKAKVKILEDNEATMKASHDGYKKSVGVTHTREWYFSPHSIKINDNLNVKKSVSGIARLYFSSHQTVFLQDGMIKSDNSSILFINATSISLKDTEIPNGYNNFVRTKYAEVAFEKNLTTVITIKNS